MDENKEEVLEEQNVKEESDNNTLVKSGTTLGHFILDRQLGVGGMGEVWLAHQGTMERLVAVKILPLKFTQDEKSIKKFMSEIKVSAKLEHPNMVSAYDAGEENGIYYLAIAYVEGSELEELIKKDGSIDETKALTIILKIANALEYAWNKFNLIHRDIKPANIMIDADNEPKLMDMGISKFAGNIEVTAENIIMGSPFYISPEQAKADKNLDFRSDMYSLGCTLFHCLTGKVPYPGTSAMQIIAQHLSTPIPNPSDIGLDVSMQCKALLKKMMAKDVLERHKSWTLLIDDIKKVLKGEYPHSAIPVQQSTTSEKLQCECGFSIIVTSSNKKKEIKCRKCGKDILALNKQQPEVTNEIEITSSSETVELMASPRDLATNSANTAKEPETSSKNNGKEKTQEELINELNSLKSKKSFLQIQGRKVCFNCGKNVYPQDLICPKCNADLENQVAPTDVNDSTLETTGEPKTPKKKSTFSFGTCLLVVILLALFLIVIGGAVAGFMFQDEILNFL